MILRALLTFSLLVLAAATPQSATADDWEPPNWEKKKARVKREAIELFRVVVKEHDDLPRCRLGGEWSDYPVPELTARQYLGSTFHANLAPEDYGTEVREILDPASTISEAFCSEAETKTWNENLVENLKNGPDQSAKTHQTRYTFPIFDQNYRLAVIMVSGQGRFWYKRDGAVRGNPPDGMGGASIYVKRKGRWRFLKHEYHYSYH